jgi:hypothetical protein
MKRNVHLTQRHIDIAAVHNLTNTIGTGNDVGIGTSSSTSTTRKNTRKHASMIKNRMLVVLIPISALSLYTILYIIFLTILILSTSHNTRIMLLVLDWASTGTLQLVATTNSTNLMPNESRYDRNNYIGGNSKWDYHDLSLPRDRRALPVPAVPVVEEYDITKKNSIIGDDSITNSNTDTTTTLSLSVSTSTQTNDVLFYDLNEILQQSICIKDSSLLDLIGNRGMSSSSSTMTTPTTTIVNGDQSDHLQLKLIRLWAVRILYAVLYDHQHQAAYQKDYRTELHQKPQLSNQCSDAKFLIISLSKNGIGANIRLGMIPALQLGIALNRVVLFINDFHDTNTESTQHNVMHTIHNNRTKNTNIPKSLFQPWTLASCKDNEMNINNNSDTHPHNNYQCYFRPISPCSVSYDEMKYESYTLQRNEIRHLFHYGTLLNTTTSSNSNVDQCKILIVPFKFRPQRQPKNLVSILYKRAILFVQRYIQQQQQKENNLQLQSILYEAVEIIQRENIDIQNDTTTETTFFNYYGVNSIIYQSFLLYTLRPNKRIQHILHSRIQSIIQQYEEHNIDYSNNNNSFSLRNTIGLPIRGTYCLVQIQNYRGFVFCFF